jgi:hypothetical protein
MSASIELTKAEQEKWTFTIPVRKQGLKTTAFF